MKSSCSARLLTAITLLGSLALVPASHGALAVYEAGDYPLGTNNPDPDAGLNSGNGLSHPSSTGFRGSYGTDITAVAGLGYSNSGGTLSTLGNGLMRISGTGFSSGGPNLYRSMPSDPFSGYRAAASGNWFGWNGSYATEIYYSVLLKWSAIATGADNRLVVKIGLDNSQFNTYLSQNGANWSFGDQAGNGYVFGPAVAGETVFVVCRMRFASATSLVMDYWFNPVLGQPLGTPAHTRTYTPSSSGGQFYGLQVRDAANILTFDEFRVGTNAANVMPVAGATAPAAPSTLTGTANSFSEIGLTWTDNSNNETQFIVERSLNGTTGWRQIASPAADSAAYTDSGLNAVTTYYYRVLATGPGGESAYSNVVSVATPSATVATPPPTNLAGVANTFSEITLTWTDNTTDETSFTLEQSPDGTSGWATLATLGANTTTFQHTGLSAETSYFYRIVANSPGGASVPSNVATTTTPALPAPVALDPISLSFADDDGLSLFLATPVTGITGFSGQGTISTAAALSYSGLPSSGNGLQTIASQRAYFTIDTSLPGLARYVSGGQIGASRLGVLYVRWLARGINAQEGNTIDFRTAANDGNTTVRASVGTTFGNDFIRAMAASSATSGINTYATSILPPSPATDLYVARFTFAESGVTTLDLFVNQTTEGTPDATVSGAIVFNTISVSKFGSAAAPAVDEFRIATSWSGAINASASPLQTWLGTFGLPVDGTGDGAYTADPDSDGASNLLEYAFDSNPIVSDGAHLPVVAKVNVDGSDYLSIAFLRRTGSSSGITYTPQGSGDLAVWDGAPIQVGAAVDHGDGTETVVFRDTVPLAAGTRRFLRVSVSAP